MLSYCKFTKVKQELLTNNMATKANLEFMISLRCENSTEYVNSPSAYIYVYVYAAYTVINSCQRRISCQQTDERSWSGTNYCENLLILIFVSVSFTEHSSFPVLGKSLDSYKSLNVINIQCFIIYKIKICNYNPIRLQCVARRHPFVLCANSKRSHNAYLVMFN